MDLLTKCDSKGRLYLKDTIREKYGELFYLVQMPGELLLIPIPKDPIKELAELGSKAGIDRIPLEELKTMIGEEASKFV